jgi:3'-phosphoadenosine 5'-phosphosulfate sulfotransferase (PAPS reductase)/FAD synthetase
VLDLELAPQSINIVTTLLRAASVLRRHRRVAVSVSGGSDSDIVVDIIERTKPNTCKIVYIFFDTGLEYTATKRHLDELEIKYGIVIERFKPRKTVPAACMKFGVPFLSKDVSNMLGRLQDHGFNWKVNLDGVTENYYGKCKSALDWYFSRRSQSHIGKSKHSIDKYRLLREFIQYMPPSFRISDKCCDYAKKYIAEDFDKIFHADLFVNGMRRAEGGRRAGRIATCFTEGDTAKPSNYRPLWYWTDEEKTAYKSCHGIRYSDCYEVYGLKRTGCVGCPCNSKAEKELKMVESFEPNLVQAARKVFGVSYAYKQQYIEFKESQRKQM